MSGRLELSGFDELREALRTLPDRLVGEAGGIVTDAAETAAAKIVAAYPERTGKLKQGVKVDRVTTSKGGAAARVVNVAKHAHIFEGGTQTRQTSLGANRGAMPPGNVFVPTVIRERRVMQTKLIALVEREGLVVTGDG